MSSILPKLSLAQHMRNALTQWTGFAYEQESTEPEETLVTSKTHPATFQEGPLQYATPGKRVVIIDIHDVNLKTLALQLGLHVGDELKILAKLPAGPTIVQRGQAEVAVGKALCDHIQVRYLY